ncbi:MAG: DNA mismatch repair endonuclease MutL [Clostridia bacterium]|nr:DNA mismatch repair endonuclease MutL [Clostridia bacterium]
MSKINILPAQVYNRIAAGEVVDRPYSVVKELVENSLDAGATQIDVYVEKGGKQLIRVVDNGCGISADDLHAAFLPHATSKIAKADDLEKIMTLGFRGEAVASIAAVSKMTITSKTAEGECYSLTSDGGTLGEIARAAGEDGTEVKVEMLFFNTPVRLGFLKSDKAEEADITTFVSRFILSHPEVSFTYYVNDKKVMQSFGGGAEEALVSVYGASILENTYKIDAQKHGLRIRGYIGNQNFSKPNKSYQSVFINGRYVSNATVSAAVSNAYSSYLMKRQYPFYVLSLEIPTEIVDVNVHPNKVDVRFADNQIVYGCIYSVISAVLDGNSKALEYLVQDKLLGIESAKEEKAEPVEDKTATTAFKMEDLLGFTYEDAKKEMDKVTPVVQKPVGKDEFGQEEPEKKKSPFVNIEDTIYGRGLPRKGETPYHDAIIPDAYEQMLRERKNPEKLSKKFPDIGYGETMFQVGNVKHYVDDGPDYFVENKKFLKELDFKAQQEKLKISRCRFVGTAFNTYIFYENDEDLYIVDQHAAHERILFDELRKGMNKRCVSQQPMIAPFMLELNAFEGEFIREHLSYIREMGIDIEEFGDTSFKISAVPTDLPKLDLSRFFHALLGEVNGIRAIRMPDLIRDKLAAAACKAAVKGGQRLTMSEMDTLWDKLDGNMGLKCPHGRPIVAKLSKTQIEKMFKRLV